MTKIYHLSVINNIKPNYSRLVNEVLILGEWQGAIEKYYHLVKGDKATFKITEHG